VTASPTARLWLDAQLSPALAAWVNRTFEGVDAQSVRSLGLRDAVDEAIFSAAREADAVVMTKDGDFVRLLERRGPPPRVIWIRLGNTSNARMRVALERVLTPALRMLREGEALVEVTDESP
jgi:predicted nuclease of predicted toxin-antitoxin system